MKVKPVLECRGAEATTIGPQKTIVDMARLLAERNKGLVLVCDGGVLRGLFNLRGVLEARTDKTEMRAEEIGTYIFGDGYR